MTIETVIYILRSSLRLTLLVVLRLFSKCIHSKRELDCHVGRHIYVIGRQVARVRELVEDDEDRNRKISCAIEIVPKILVKLSVSTEKETLTLVCKEGTERFAQDLAYWILESQALHFNVQMVTDEEYEQMSVVPEA